VSTIVQVIPDGVPIDGTLGRGGVDLGEAPVRVAAVYLAGEVLEAATIRAILADGADTGPVALAEVAPVVGPPASIAFVPSGGVPLPGDSTLAVVVPSHTGSATLWIVLE
jgi:hypothetical protein